MVTVASGIGPNHSPRCWLRSSRSVATAYRGGDIMGPMRLSMSMFNLSSDGDSCQTVACVALKDYIRRAQPELEGVDGVAQDEQTESDNDENEAAAMNTFGLVPVQSDSSRAANPLVVDPVTPALNRREVLLSKLDKRKAATAAWQTRVTRPRITEGVEPSPTACEQPSPIMDYICPGASPRAVRTPTEPPPETPANESEYHDINTVAQVGQPRQQMQPTEKRVCLPSRAVGIRCQYGGEDDISHSVCTGGL